MSENIREGILIGLGNPLLDISAVVDTEFLEKYGMKANDAILAEEKHKSIYNEMIKNYKVEYTAGGATQNSLRVAQWILKKPNIAAFMGAVGVDEYSKILEDIARSDGVNVRYQHVETQPTGTCAVLITDNGNKRSLCANLAAANCFTPDHIRIPENKNLIDSASFFYISGFFLTVSPPTIMEVANHALNTDKIFMMNLSAPFLCQFFKEPMMAVFPYIDILFGNEMEAAAFAKEQNLNTTDMREIALKMSKMEKRNTKRPRIVVITQGHNPVLYVENGIVREVPAITLATECVVDTNGAGDAFVGGFIAQRVQDRPLELCVRCGVWTATEVIQRSGCTFDATASFPE